MDRFTVTIVEDYRFNFVPGFARVRDPHDDFSVYSKATVLTMLEAIKKVPDPLTKFLSAAADVEPLQPRISEFEWPNVADTLRELDLSRRQTTYARQLHHQVAAGFRYEANFERNNGIFCDPALMLTVAVIAKNRK